MSDPRVIVFGGPSGSGKSTLIAGLLREPGMRLAVSVTTRPPRAGERDGVDYRFVDEPAFERMRAAGELLEWARVHRYLYGTPRSETAPRAPGERFVILDVDEAGLRNVKTLGIAHVSIFIAPPSMEDLERRLRARATESETDLAVRLEGAARAMAARDDYDHVVVNHRVDKALDEIRTILGIQNGAGVQAGNQSPSSTRR